MFFFETMSFPRRTIVVKCMAGLLTRFHDKHLPENTFSGIELSLIMLLRNLQQRDCLGLSPNSLLITLSKIIVVNHYSGKGRK